MVKKVNTITVLGSDGFIGKNLIEGLKRNGEYAVQTYDIHDSEENLECCLKNSDLIFNLAGVNRPQNEAEFEEGNTNFTKKLIALLERAKNFAPVVLTSSTQAELQNPYGKSKKKAEDALIEYSKKHKAKALIYRLPNVFGKWCRPNYNSVVATFCHNISHRLDISISNADNELKLIYIDDVVNEFLSIAKSPDTNESRHFYEAAPVHTIKLGALAERIKSFFNIRQSLLLPDFSDVFNRNLYATYLSYLDKDDFAYPLIEKKDSRGSLFEFIKSDAAGQVFVSKTRAGVLRGNHYHNTKVEKFCVIEGEAVARFRSIIGDEVISVPVSGREIKVIDIPPGYTHSIENTGGKEMIVIFWADEIYKCEQPDTIFLEVNK